MPAGVSSTVMLTTLKTTLAPSPFLSAPPAADLARAIVGDCFSTAKSSSGARFSPEDTVLLRVASTVSCTAALHVYAALFVAYTAPCEDSMPS